MRKDGDATTPAVGLVGVIRHHVAQNEAGEEIEEFEMGYGLHSSFWNAGYGSEAVTAFLNLFWSLESRKDVPYLMCWISDSNEPSQKLCKKMGGKQRMGVVATHEGHDLGIWVIDRPKS
jgi:RimJ/RimL family protein N-acetyltransferase